MNTNYETYDALDFAQDDAFIQWVKSADATKQDFWEEWLEKHPEKATVIAEAKSIVLSIQVKEKEPGAEKVSALWDKIEAVVEEEAKIVPISKKSSFIRWLPYAAAAAVAILVFIVFYDTGTTIETEYAQLEEHVLPDGSTVELNAGSKIWYEPDNWEDDRKIRLEGEAFFTVEKGSRFVVETTAGQVEVLGTSFNVYNRNEEFEVECFTGKVAVKTASNSSRTLEPGDATKSQSDGKLSEVFEVDTDTKAGWRKGKIDLDGVSLRRALAEIGRQFDYEVEALVEDATLNELYDFYFETNNIDSALTRVTLVGPVIYELQGRKIIINEN